MLKTQVIQRHTGWCHPSFKLLYNQLASLDMIYSALEAKLASLDVIYSPEVLGIGVICTNFAHQLDRRPVVRSHAVPPMDDSHGYLSDDPPSVLEIEINKQFHSCKNMGYKCIYNGL